MFSVILRNALLGLGFVMRDSNISSPRQWVDDGNRGRRGDWPLTEHMINAI
jgi:hypothetical protein